jgi:hypothetical protein
VLVLWSLMHVRSATLTLTLTVDLMAYCHSSIFLPVVPNRNIVFNGKA